MTLHCRGIVIILIGLASTALAKVPSTQPTLSDDEKKAGWVLLFDGTTTAGWRGLGMDHFPSVWHVEDGNLHCTGGGKDANDLVTEKEYENFDLYFEWMVPKLKGNSGLKYRVQEKKGQGFAFGCEYQCMYDPDQFNKEASGSLYDVIAPKGKILMPQGEFNISRIILHGNHVEHWLNGVKVVDAEFGSPEMEAAIAKSKFKNTNWGKKPLGHIILQDHHDEVYFRNLKIRESPPTDSK